MCSHASLERTPSGSMHARGLERLLSLQIPARKWTAGRDQERFSGLVASRYRKIRKDGTEHFYMNFAARCGRVVVHPPTVKFANDYGFYFSLLMKGYDHWS